MKIGITERGDASINYEWINALKNNTVNGAILITKNITDKFITSVMQLYNNGYKNIIVHATCTGWGGSPVEPHVIPYTEQLKQLEKLIENGFPIENCVLRIDPIIPTPEGINATKHVIDTAITFNLLPKIRVRISILDEYKHVKERLKNAGYAPFYPGTAFQAPKYMIDNLINMLSQYNFKIETCAEKVLCNHSQFITQGCISQKDLQIMNLQYDSNLENMQNRNGCHCLACKTELLTHKHQCPNGCLYCYWRN